MGSTSDLGHCEKIKKTCGNFGIPCELRVTSAHKGPDETLRIKAEYEGKHHITRTFVYVETSNAEKDLPHFQEKNVII